MPKLPRISGDDTIAKLERNGYRAVRQTGSHVRLRSGDGRNPLTVPRHKELKSGLLRKILKDAELTVEEFIVL
ncbi:addiction module toxin, HicA family [Patescibacteria group bacterium]|jgi:predicted RNA binding protein YcfA (HicA-like mRNA interferase family)|nr:addiction module toxin, HicA family [Patescibacteria group bacterium]